MGLIVLFFPVISNNTIRESTTVNIDFSINYIPHLDLPATVIYVLYSYINLQRKQEHHEGGISCRMCSYTPCACSCIQHNSLKPAHPLFGRQNAYIRVLFFFMSKLSQKLKSSMFLIAVFYHVFSKIFCGLWRYKLVLFLI